MLRDILPEIARLGGPAALGRAVVVEVRGSTPRPPGAVLVATADGRFAGTLAGGCVESAAVEEIRAAMAAGRTRIVSYGLDDPGSWNVGLACGGAIRALVEPRLRPELVALAESERGGVLATDLGGAGDDALVVTADGAATGLGAGFGSHAAEVRSAALAAFAAGESRCVSVAGGAGEAFLEVVAPPPRLFVYGASEIGAALVALAKVAGFRTVVADARPAFLVAERFPGADRLLRAWPDEAFAAVRPDARTAIVLLTHDPKLDVPALRAALGSPAPYVGLIGSRKTQRFRREALRAEGVPEEAIARIRGPVGLDLGGRSAAEVALAILAEIVAARNGASGRPLRDAP